MLDTGAPSTAAVTSRRFLCRSSGISSARLSPSSARHDGAHRMESHLECCCGGRAALLALVQTTATGCCAGATAEGVAGDAIMDHEAVCTNRSVKSSVTAGRPASKQSAAAVNQGESVNQLATVRSALCLVSSRLVSS